MGVVPGDPRALTEIESHLAKSDPALAAKFAAFAADPSRARQPMRETECQPPTRDRAANRAPNRAQHAWAGHARAERVAILIVLALALALCITMAALTAS